MFALRATSATGTVRYADDYISRDDSVRIGILRIFLVVLLVFLHFGGLYGSEYSPWDGYMGQEHAPAAIFVTAMVFFAFAAVPTLSMISGMLFFKDATPELPPDFVRKWRSRVPSLLVPFVLWSSATVSAFLIAGGLFPDLLDGLTVIEGSRFLDIANALFGVTTIPFVGQFWFVRDLIVTIAFAPVIWFLMGRAPVITLLTLGFLWISDQTLGLFLRLDCLMFFSLGAGFALHRVRADLGRVETVGLGVLFVALVAARTLLPWMTGLDRDDIALVLITACLRLVGAIAAWNLAAMITRSSIGRDMAKFGDLAFFVFCAHSPLILVLKELFGGAIAPMSSAAHLSVYFLAIVSTLAIVTAAAWLLRSVWPGLFAVLNGGRS